jgi:hypothetical protein
LLISGGAAREQTAVEPITVADLTRRPVLGRLGQPLGKIVTIEGVFADGNLTKMKMDDGWILVRVRVVDGKRLEKERVFQYEQSRKASPKVDSEFKFIGYETGGFTGIPGDAFKYTLPVATTGYGFTTSFVFLRDERARK